MNKPARPIFSTIIKAMEDYRDTVAAVCEKYRKDVDAAAKYAAKYKDEKQILADKRLELTTKARETIRKLGRDMGVTIAMQLDKLKDLVETDLCHAVPAGAQQLLNLYNTYGPMPLTKTEIETLVTVNGGHITGLRCIAALLKRTGSPYTVRFADVEQLESDMARLARFAVLAEYSPAVPQEYLHEAVQIFAGEKHIEVVPAKREWLQGAAASNELKIFDNTAGDTLKVNELAKAAHIYRFINGEAVDTQRDHDIISLQGECADFESTLEAAREMSKYWSSDIGEVKDPDEEENATDTETTEETEEDEYNNLPAEESATKIEESEDADIALARQLGREQAERNKPIDYKAL